MVHVKSCAAINLWFVQKACVFPPSVSQTVGFVSVAFSAPKAGIKICWSINISWTSLMGYNHLCVSRKAGFVTHSRFFVASYIGAPSFAVLYFYLFLAGIWGQWCTWRASGGSDCFDQEKKQGKWIWFTSGHFCTKKKLPSLAAL